jgi:hypothetical protein
MLCLLAFQVHWRRLLQNPQIKCRYISFWPDMAGDRRAPKMVRMSSCGHFDADLVIFECRTYPIWLTAAILDFGEMAAPTWQVITGLQKQSEWVHVVISMQIWWFLNVGTYPIWLTAAIFDFGKMAANSNKMLIRIILACKNLRWDRIDHWSMVFRPFCRFQDGRLWLIDWT